MGEGEAMLEDGLGEESLVVMRWNWKGGAIQGAWSCCGSLTESEHFFFSSSVDKEETLSEFLFQIMLCLFFHVVSFEILTK